MACSISHSRTESLSSWFYHLLSFFCHTVKFMIYTFVLELKLSSAVLWFMIYFFTCIDGKWQIIPTLKNYNFTLCCTASFEIQYCTKKLSMYIETLKLIKNYFERLVCEKKTNKKQQWVILSSHRALSYDSGSPALGCVLYFATDDVTELIHFVNLHVSLQINIWCTTILSDAPGMVQISTKQDYNLVSFLWTRQPRGHCHLW